MTTPAPLRPIRAVLADDERLMRDQLRSRLAQAWPELQVVAEAKNGEEAVAQVIEHAPDLVFLDIRMPGMNGIEAARAISQLEWPEDRWLPEIVFITAYDQHAVEAFEQGAADYVLKPAEPERLARTAARLRQRLAGREAQDATRDLAGDAAQDATPDTRRDSTQAAAAAPPAAAPASLQHLLYLLGQGPGQPPREAPLKIIQASVGTTIQMIPVAEVLFFISDEKYTRVQTAQLEALIRKPIKELVAELDPDQFWQIHRSTLVNVRAIQRIERDERGRQTVHLHGHPERLEVSRSFLGLFKGM